MGNYSIKLSEEVRYVIHCDLGVDALNCAYERAKGIGLKNIFFVRCDYLQLPFKSNAFDSLVCLDTLERGLHHEMRLLSELLRCLKLYGKAVVDFHNQSRSRLFGSKPEIKEYSFEEIKRIMLKTSSKNIIKPFGYVPTGAANSMLYRLFVPFERSYPFLDRIFRFFPPIRYIVLLEKCQHGLGLSQVG